MQHNKIKYIKNILFPCLILSLITGIFTGALIFIFKVSAEFVIGKSLSAYAFVRANPVWLPLLVLGAVLIGFLATLILKHTKNCRGGGIPTSVAILRGLINFHWLKSIFHLFGSAMLTFMGGVPLGNEGPSVQMGTAVGRGTVRLFGKKYKAWDRYTMTGGACGGFACATGAPLTGIIFAFEEVHRRFSPLLFMTVSLIVAISTAVMRVLCSAFGISPYMFGFSIQTILPLKFIWIAIAIGLVCGFVAFIFTKIYALIGKFLSDKLKGIPFSVKITFIFGIVGLLGFAGSGFIGSGHSLIDQLIEGNGVWYMLLIYFCVRALVLMFANHAGVSGGIFLPTLTFGAIIGTLFSKFAVQTNILPQEYFLIPIIIGMASFLSASSRTPITAIAFAIEALSGFSNTLFIVIGVTISYLIIEILGIPSLQEMVITQRVDKLNEDKDSTVVDSFITVMPESFAIGKDIKNILWPSTCIVLSIRKAKKSQTLQDVGILEEGDRLHIHYQTFSQQATFEALEAIVGEQPESPSAIKHTVDKINHIVPDNIN